MTCFDFVLYHKLGKTMQAEDPLSRRADHEIGIDLDNTNQVLLKPEFFAINALETTQDYKSLLKSGPREFEKSLQDWNYENRLLLYSVKDVQSKSRVTQSGVELLRSGKELITKVEEQPWPQFMCCALICCHVCGCIFQKDRIVARSFREEWYRLIGVRIG